MCVFENETEIRNLHPDQKTLGSLEGRIQNATAPGTETDCVSRSFCPKLSIAEDPVCGSAHILIADYWAGVLGKNRIMAWQASVRGGRLCCSRIGAGKIAIRGRAVLTAVSEILASAESDIRLSVTGNSGKR